MMLSPERIAEREKRAVALSSVVAAVGLTLVKIVVGLATNSLGILSEAAHSGLDLVAAVITLAAVRVSDRPPDREHPYGHGKVENLSALVETLLLLGTCVWIVIEAVRRLFVREAHVEVTVWAFAVMAVSILVDVTRSRALMKVARKHRSQALEADALHFSTDIWSSAVVIVGLACVAASEWLRANTTMRADWLHHADAVAALAVSGIVVAVSVRLGKRTIDALLDAAPKGLVSTIESAVSSVTGVSAAQRVRVRHSGAATFVDMALAVGRSASFEEAARIAREAEEAVHRLLPRADVMVRIDPVVKDEASLVERIWSAAARHGVGVHGIRAQEIRGRIRVEMHAEVPDDLTLGQAHDRVSAVEETIRGEVQGLADIVTHIEPVGDREVLRRGVPDPDRDLARLIAGLAHGVPGVRDVHDTVIHREDDGLSVSFHCLMEPEIPISDAHQITVRLESLLRARFPELGRVVIHVEPLEPGAPGP
jgi:cation diffusion facilitator family transporter